MPKKNNAKKTKLNLIETAEDTIICSDAKLTLSDARMEKVLLHVYELACDDANRFRMD